MKSLLCFSLLCLSLLANAQSWRPNVQPNSAEILHRLQKLQVLGSCLYIAAHPDDENTRLLAWLANQKKVRTGYLSLTRGDGGQNLIGPEQGEALGLIRTQELLAARRIDGAEQFFTRAYDFGYSKTPEETFRIWNKDSVLADVVWVIRQFRPDVIITRFPTTGEGGHGHHTASAMLAVEAFDAAADPRRFPEQLQYVSVWQPRRLFWNTFNFGGTNSTAPGQLQVDVGGYNPLLGKSYGEIAAEARSMHKSQGFGTAAQRGSSVEYFKLLKGDSVKEDLFEGIDLTWGRIGLGKNLELELQKLAEKFQPSDPQKSLPSLFQMRRLLSEYLQAEPVGPNRLFAAKKALDIRDLISACTGVYLEALAFQPTTVTSYKAGMDTTAIAIHAINRGGVSLRVEDIIYWPHWLATTYQSLWSRHDTSIALLPNKLYADTFRYAQQRHHPSSPKRLNFSSGNTPTWDERFAWAVTLPEDEPLIVGFEMSVAQSRNIFQQRSIVYKTTDPVKGEIYRPFEILPPVTANFSDRAFVFEGTAPKTVSIRVQSHGDSARGWLELTAPTGWKVSIAQPEFYLKGRGAETTIMASVTPSGTAAEGILKASLLVGGERYTRAIRRIEYEHIPPQFYLPPAEARLMPVALKTGGKSIGYIVGAGDDVPAALRGVGYTVTELDEAAITGGDLSKYSAIVTGVRAYNTQEWLQGAHEKLAAYARAGGNLIVQYNTNNRIGPVKARIAPDSFTITRDRITDETAAVNFLSPRHPALNAPNKISSEDFSGWIQERSIYHASNWAPSYTPILSMADPGEKPNEGALIIAPYGKGNVVYTGLAFFRQLPAGVPGAYRLFANLLALPQNK